MGNNNRYNSKSALPKKFIDDTTGGTGVESSKKFKLSRKLTLTIVTSIALILLIGTIVFAKFLASPEVQVLKALQDFTTNTVKQDEYFFYDLDVNQLINQYLCADVSYEGKATVSNLKGLGVPVTITMNGGRSYEQQQMKVVCSPSITILALPKITVFANNEKCYLHSPDADMEYVLPVTTNLFPELHSSENSSGKSWIKKNEDNIIDLIKKSPIKVTGQKITTSNGLTAEEYLITIKKGDAQFLWDYLGIPAPDHDEHVSLYITDDSRIARIVLDFSDILDGTTVTLDGLNASTLILEGEVPGQGSSTITITRDHSEAKLFLLNISVDSEKEDDYLVDGKISWKNSEEGFKLEIKELKIYTNEELTATINYKGTIVTTDSLPDLFEKLPEDTSIFKETTWEGFFNEMIDSYM